MAAASFVTHLEGAIDGAVLPARTLQTTHEGRPILVRYDLDGVKTALARSDLHDRPPTMWRYRELLPVEDESHIVTLGETMTPLLPCPRLGGRLGVERLFVKDESRLPTGSFKSRGMAMAVSMAHELGIKRVAAPTAGNAGGALAAYAARASMDCFIFMPDSTPMINRYEAALHGAKAFLVNGLITDCGRIVREGTEKMGWFDMSTLKEPYRIEGKKTMGLELAEQMNWRLPHAILYPTGGGTGLIGMWKAFTELAELGWLDEARRPRMYACQSTTCPPMVNAFEAGDRFAVAPENPHTAAAGLCVPSAVGDFLILDAVRESGGKAMAADEHRLEDWMRLACELEGIALCPESAFCVGVLERAVAEGEIRPDETVVIFNTAAAQKYAEVIEADLPRLDHAGGIDWAALA
ncbi:MAG: threonine synthase [Phycisphaerales bacterium]|nr:MAG: threonine synthase [Phycisphaerales bacterium]